MIGMSSFAYEKPRSASHPKGKPSRAHSRDLSEGTADKSVKPSLRRSLAFFCNRAGQLPGQTIAAGPDSAGEPVTARPVPVLPWSDAPASARFRAVGPAAEAGRTRTV